MPLDLERIYRSGLRASDYAEIAPGSILVEPVPAPEKVGLIVTSTMAEAIVSTAAILYRVVGVPAGEPGYKDGDIISVRNGFLESVHPSGKLLSIQTRHVLGVLRA